MSCRVRLFWRCGALLLAITAPAEAQRFAGSASAYNVQYRVLFAGAVREQTGMWLGLDGSVRLGRLEIGASGQFGSLGGAADSTNPDRTVRVSTIGLRVLVSRALAAGLEAEAKRFETDVGVTTWRLVGLAVRLAPALGATGLEGVAELTYFVSAGVVGGASMGPAFRGTFGVRYEIPRSPVTARLAYRFERFDFDQAGSSPARLEQLRGAVIGVGLRLP